MPTDLKLKDYDSYRVIDVLGAGQSLRYHSRFQLTISLVRFSQLKRKFPLIEPFQLRLNDCWIRVYQVLLVSYRTSLKPVTQSVNMSEQKILSLTVFDVAPSASPSEPFTLISRQSSDECRSSKGITNLREIQTYLVWFGMISSLSGHEY